MSLNLADSGRVMAVYDAVLNNELNWFLLYHSSRIADELALYGFGTEGLEELKTKIDPTDPQQTLIGLIRVDSDFVPVNRPSSRHEEDEDEDGEARFVMISYVPKGISGVRKARAKVHTRRLGMIFKKHDAVLSVDDISQLTNTAIAKSLAEPDPSLLTFTSSAAPPIAITTTGIGQQFSPVSSPESVRPPIQLDTTTAGTVVYSSTPPATSPTIDPPLDLNNENQYHQHSFTAINMGRSLSQPMATHVGPFQGPTYVELKPVQRSASETTHSPPPPAKQSFTGSHTKLGSQISSFLRRKKRSGSATAGLERSPTSAGLGGMGMMGMGDVDESQESADDSMPPPTPPKDKGIYAPVVEKAGGEPAHRPLSPQMQVHTEYSDDISHTQPNLHEPELLTLPPGLKSVSESSFRHTHSISEFAVVSHEEMSPGSGGADRLQGGSDDRDIVVIMPEEFGIYGRRHGKPLPARGGQRPQQHFWGIDTLKKGKWATPQGLTAIRDPAERARLRMELQKQKEEEEREVLRAEEERQAMVKRQKEIISRMEEEEAEHRKALILEEARRSASERRRREERERLEEERKAREMQERKHIERQKRIEEHLKLEEWRKEQQRLAEESARAEKEAKQREEEERKMKIRNAEKDVKVRAKEGSVTGWVTIQTDESVMWRRRYFKFSPNTFYFYRSPKDLTQVLDRLDVRGAVKALKEPKEGYEDLRAIPHSFAIEFHDRAAWAMFADSEEEKFRLLGLLQYSAGLQMASSYCFACLDLDQLLSAMASMAGLVSPKPIPYSQYNTPYPRAPTASSIASYSDTPPSAPSAHQQQVTSAGGNPAGGGYLSMNLNLNQHQHLTNLGMNLANGASLGGVAAAAGLANMPGLGPPGPGGSPGLGSATTAAQDDEKIYALVIDLMDPETRDTALLELSKKREQYDDLALVLWHSFGIMPALLQEIVSVYPMLSPPNLTATVSNRVCNALALLQCVASHSETRQLFLNAHIPLFLYPFLNTTSKTRPFEYLRLTSLGVIGALVKQNDNNAVIHFLLSTEIIPLCLRIMETGSELSKTVAIFIVQKILLDETGLTYICHTYERFYAVGTVLSNMVNQLVETQAVRLLKHVVRCYLRLSDNVRAREALRACLPEPLRDNTFSTLLKGDLVTKRCLTTLLNNLNEP